MATIDEIKQQAEAVKNASHVGENTALRVGGVLVDLCEWMKKLSDNAGNGGGGTSGGSGVSLGTLLTKLNTDNPFPTASGQVLTYNGSNFIWKTPTGGSGVALNPTMSAMNNQLGKTSYGTPQFLYWDGSTYTWKNESDISGSGGSSSRIDTIKLFNSLGNEFDSVNLGSGNTIGFMQGDNVTLQAVVKDNINVIKISASGGSGSSGTTSGKLRFYKDSSEESWNGESDFKIIFGSGLNVTWDSHSQITLSATGGSTGGSSGGSVSWSDVTNKPSTFTPSSHTHSTSDINGLSNYVQGIKVNNADKATQLANPRLIWGQSFNGTGDINGNLKMGTAGGGSIQLWMNGGNMLDRTDNTLHIGYGLKASSDGEIYLDAYRTVVYTDNMSKHYDFKSNVFDVNTNTIHFGSEANGGTLSWDSANKCFKINGSVYATGGITALGVRNNVTTSNNVDFTFKSVTANTFYVIDSIQLSDGLKLNRNVCDIDLVSIDGNVNSLYLDGEAESYYLSSDGGAYFSTLGCETFNLPGADDFKIVDLNNTGFSIQFTYDGKTYKFTPSEGSVSVS